MNAKWASIRRSAWSNLKNPPPPGVNRSTSPPRRPRRTPPANCRPGTIAETSELFSSFLKPELPSSGTSQLDTPAQIQQQETLTGRVAISQAATAPIDIVPASTFSLSGSPDATETLTNVATAPTVQARRRSPIGFDPRIRGYHTGQIYNSIDNGYQSPVRGDLDAIFSKLDQDLVGNVQVISGPYGVRYGSGFAFLIADTIPTPRYENGRETHLKLGTNIRANGGQTFNSATLYGGTDRSGYYANVGYRKGSDYEAGDGLLIPSSYDAMSVFSKYGYDIDDQTRTSTSFSYVDQGPTEYAAQFFDTEQIEFFGVTHSLIHEDDFDQSGMRLDLFFNDTSFLGDTRSAGKRRDDFPVLQRIDNALFTAAGSPTGLVDPQFAGDVDGELTTAGVRLSANNQITPDINAVYGADYRFTSQRIDEQFNITSFGFSQQDGIFRTGLPTTDVHDPGLYVESAINMSPDWDVAIGSRVAFVTTTADGEELRETSNFRDANGDINRDLSQFDVLSSAFITNDFKLTPNYDARIGFGFAERVPDLTDRYSDGLFLAIIQSGFSRVNGNPELAKERNYQFDVRVTGDYENVRGRFSAFHSWITDYNTYFANPINDPLGARLLSATNTNLATLAGLESYGEVDFFRGIQGFASLNYLDGRDREIDQPLPGIFPLQSRLGLRLSDGSPASRWGLEWGWQIVDNQDRLGTLRAAGTGNDPIPLESDTPGYAVSYLRGFLNASDRVSLTGGVENLFDRNYYEHLSLRLPATANFGNTFVLSPGITPYLGVQVTY